jgi:hypothetical protein
VNLLLLQLIHTIFLLCFAVSKKYRTFADKRKLIEKSNNEKDFDDMSRDADGMYDGNG